MRKVPLHMFLYLYRKVDIFFLQFWKMCGRIYKFHTVRGVTYRTYYIMADRIYRESGCTERQGWGMIEVTKINGVKILINPDLLELVEETPDTVLTFTTGRKIIVKESRQEVKNLVKSYRKDIFAD